MVVIDTGFQILVRPLHAFHQSVFVVHVHFVGVWPDRYLLPEGPGGYGVGPSGCLDSAQVEHLGPELEYSGTGDRRTGCS